MELLVFSLQFHAILVTQQPQLLAPLGQLSPSRHLSILTSRLSRCLTHHEVAIYSGSTLALSLLSLELEVLTPEWLALTIMLQRMLQVRDECSQSLQPLQLCMGRWLKCFQSTKTNGQNCKHCICVSYKAICHEKYKLSCTLQQVIFRIICHSSLN